MDQVTTAQDEAIPSLADAAVVKKSSNNKEHTTSLLQDDAAHESKQVQAMPPSTTKYRTRKGKERVISLKDTSDGSDQDPVVPIRPTTSRQSSEINGPHAELATVKVEEGSDIEMPSMKTEDIQMSDSDEQNHPETPGKCVPLPSLQLANVRQNR